MGAETIAHVRIIPQMVVASFVGEMFTVACVIENVNNLSGVGLFFKWNTTCLDYISHTLTIPVEDYPSPQTPSPYSGIIHEPELVIQDRVTEIEGTYEVAVTTLGGSAFNGSGTLFTMTFQVMHVPWFQNYTDTFLQFDNVDLGDPYAAIIPNTEQDGVVRILNPFASHHDIAVMDVYSSRENGIVIPVVGQGYLVDISAVLDNEGSYAEIFNLTICVNTTQVMEILNISFNPIDQEIFNFTWDTTEWALGTYIINASVSLVLDEVDPTDNYMTYTMLVSMPGDVDADHDVDIFDIVAIAGVYGVSAPDPLYDSILDVDGDGNIDIFDIVAACSHYGESW